MKEQLDKTLCEIVARHKTIDLTHALHAKVPTWSGSCGFQRTVTADYDESKTPTKFQFQCLQMSAGIGTHMDAPCHCFKGGLGIADIALTQLVLPLIVLDVSSKAHVQYLIDTSDISHFEKTHGKIPPGCLVIAHTGWSRHWNDPILYRNADERGQVHFPSFHPEAAQILFERGALGIAIDTLSPDLGIDGICPVHDLFLGAGKYLVENVANSHLLPPVGALGIVLPIKVSEGSEAPVRFIALV